MPSAHLCSPMDTVVTQEAALRQPTLPESGSLRTRLRRVQRRLYIQALRSRLTSALASPADESYAAGYVDGVSIDVELVGFSLECLAMPPSDVTFATAIVETSALAAFQPAEDMFGAGSVDGVRVDIELEVLSLESFALPPSDVSEVTVVDDTLARPARFRRRERRLPTIALQCALRGFHAWLSRLDAWTSVPAIALQCAVRCFIARKRCRAPSHCSAACHAYSVFAGFQVAMRHALLHCQGAFGRAANTCVCTTYGGCM